MGSMEVLALDYAYLGDRAAEGAGRQPSSILPLSSLMITVASDVAPGQGVADAWPVVALAGAELAIGSSAVLFLPDNEPAILDPLNVTLDTE